MSLPYCLKNKKKEISWYSTSKLPKKEMKTSERIFRFPFPVKGT